MIKKQGNRLWLIAFQLFALLSLLFGAVGCNNDDVPFDQTTEPEQRVEIIQTVAPEYAKLYTAKYNDTNSASLTFVDDELGWRMDIPLTWNYVIPWVESPKKGYGFTFKNGKSSCTAHVLGEAANLESVKKEQGTPNNQYKNIVSKETILNTQQPGYVFLTRSEPDGTDTKILVTEINSRVLMYSCFNASEIFVDTIKTIRLTH